VAKHQKKPTLKSVAARRDQTIEQLLRDWSVTSLDDLAKRCKREGVEFPANFTFSIPATPPAVKNALVDLSKESEELQSKKARKGKLTQHEPSTSDKHVGVDAIAAAGPKDPT
jgi:hypothetical protein